MSEQVFNDIELLDESGVVYNTIIATESYAEHYVATHGGTWRHRPMVEAEE